MFYVKQGNMRETSNTAPTEPTAVMSGEQMGAEPAEKRLRVKKKRDRKSLPQRGKIIKTARRRKAYGQKL